MADDLEKMDAPALREEIARLNKIINALMDRAEQGSAFHDSDFSLFQTAIMLEDQVKLRTAELERALYDNESVTRALRESETRFRTLVNQSMIGIAIIEENVDALGYANEKLGAIFGYDGPKLRTMSFAMLVAAEDRPSLNDALTRLWHGKSQGEDLLLHGNRSDGSELDIEVHCSVMNIGGTRAIISLVNDVTERTRAARQIDRLLREQTAILNSRVVGFVKLKGRNFEWANAAAADALGYSREELIGLPTRIMYLDDQSHIDFGERAYSAMQRGEIFHTEVQYRRKDGSVGWYSIAGEALFPGSDESVWACADISERMQNQEELEQHRHHLEEMVCSRTWELAEARDAAEAASLAKSVFLAHMSHELRTPLNGIMGMTALALRSATDPAQINQLTKSAQASRHLLAIINDILDLSRIESGRMTLHPRQFSFIQALNDACRMHEDQAKAKGLRLTLRIAPDIPDQLHGDDLRLKQMVINFVDNAIKFSERGMVGIYAHAAEDDGPGLLIRVEVSDEGVGLTDEQQTRLFQPFSQVDDSPTRQHGGTGLGLSITKRLANLMGGEVGVISRAGIGSTFWFTVRIEHAGRHKATLPDKAPPETPEMRLARKFGGARVLIAEDDPLSQEVARMLLEESGLEAVVVSNGRDAVDRVRAERFALILMDMRMPVMDGLTASLLIREQPGMESVPILAMTANAFDEDRESCLNAGMDDHLGKPLEPDAFLGKVLFWLKQRKKNRCPS